MSRKVAALILLVAAALLVVLRPVPTPRSAEEQEAVAPPHAPGTLVLDLEDGASADQVAEAAALLGVPVILASEVSADEALYVAEVADLADAVDAVRGLSDVEAVEPAVDVEMLGWPNDPRWSEQWNLQMIGQPGAWRAGRGQGVRVAVIDTGVSPVEDLEGVALAEGRSFVPGEPTSRDGHGHGTHVAGTIAQATHNGVGVAGIAPEATLLPYKALNARGGGRSDWIAAAIDQAVDDGADVINMSLGGAYSRVIDVAVQKAVAEGVVVIAAAGNTGRRGIGCPACLEEVIAVSALGPDGEPAPYSSYGKGVEIAAPGGDLRKTGGGILQDTVDGRGGHAYKAFQGTSMAAPHVAGATAALMSMGISGDRAVDALLSPARADAPGQVTEKLGHGRLDLAAASRAVLFQQRGTRFAVAGGLALMLAAVAGLGAGFALRAGVFAALAAGGLFFLPLLPLDPGRAVDVLSRGILGWPEALGHTSVGRFPLWASALLPAGVAFLFGFSRTLGAAVAGLCLGLGVALFYGGVAHTLDVSIFSHGVERVWLLANGAAAVALGLAVLGIQRARRAS